MVQIVILVVVVVVVIAVVVLVVVVVIMLIRRRSLLSRFQTFNRILCCQSVAIFSYLMTYW